MQAAAVIVSSCSAAATWLSVFEKLQSVPVTPLTTKYICGIVYEQRLGCQIFERQYDTIKDGGN
jgi:hypothetical protein